jgi:AraC family transcriptional regulator, arabinose operon regulatory protein
MDFVVFVMDDLLVERRAEGFIGQQLYWVPQMVLQRIEARPFTRHAVVTCLGYYPDTRGHFVERSEGLEEYVMLFVETGAGWIETRGRREEIAAGEVVLLPPREKHAYGSNEKNPWTLYWFHFRGQIVEELLEWTKFSAETRIMTCAAWDGVRREFHTLFHSLERGYHEHNLLEMSRVLINVLTLLNRNPSRERPQEARDRIEQAMDRMRETLTHPLTLEEYAREAGYSVPRYCHWFKHFTGVSPMAFLTELRIQSACEYLDTTSLAIKEIAAILGYEDPYYFSRAFAKCTGQSPMKYREGGDRGKVSKH